MSPNVQCREKNILIKWPFTAFSVSRLRAQTLMPAVNVVHLVCLFGSVGGNRLISFQDRLRWLGSERVGAKSLSGTYFRAY